MSDKHLPALTALVDRIIPADDWPSASQNNVVPFILNLLDRDLSHERTFVLDGLLLLDAEARNRFGEPFAKLDEWSQDAVLKDIEAGKAAVPKPEGAASLARWFELMVRITQEGYYADRSNGANPEHASWKMVGYDPRRAI